MEYAVLYENGDVYTSSEKTWAQMPRDKIESILVYDADNQKYMLSGFDVWFFSDVARCQFGKDPVIEARLIGAFHTETGQGTICMLTPSGDYKEVCGELTEYKKTFNDSSFIHNEI